jgi:hypothetical protein
LEHACGICFSAFAHYFNDSVALPQEFPPRDSVDVPLALLKGGMEQIMDGGNVQVFGLYKYNYNNQLT